MKQDIQEILYSEEILSKRIKELASEISTDYRGKDLLIVGILKRISNICCRANKKHIY